MNRGQPSIRVALAALWLLGAKGLGAQRSGGVTGEGLTGHLSVPSARTLPHGTWAAALTFDYQRFPATSVRQQSGLVSGDWDYAASRIVVAAAYGLFDRIELAASTSLETRRSDAGVTLGVVDGRFVQGQLDRHGQGDGHLAAKARLFGDRGSWLGVAAFGDVGIPLSDAHSNSITIGDVSWSGALAVSMLDFAFTARTGRSGGFGTVRLPTDTRIGVGYSAAITERVDVLGEMNWTLYRGGSGHPSDRWLGKLGPRVWLGAYREWSVDAGVSASRHWSEGRTNPALLLRIARFPRYDVLYPGGKY